MAKNITPCPKPFDEYGYDNKGRLWKKKSLKAMYFMMAPRGHHIVNGVAAHYYTVCVKKIQYIFCSSTKQFKEL